MSLFLLLWIVHFDKDMCDDNSDAHAFQFVITCKSHYDHNSYTAEHFRIDDNDGAVERTTGFFSLAIPCKSFTHIEQATQHINCNYC